jgi:hypothetical protein
MDLSSNKSKKKKKSWPKVKHYFDESVKLTIFDNNKTNLL